LEAVVGLNDSGFTKTATNVGSETAGDVGGGKLEKAIGESSPGGKGATTTSRGGKSQALRSVTEVKTISIVIT
jgi:hypothetical protein